MYKQAENKENKTFKNSIFKTFVKNCQNSIYTFNYCSIDFNSALTDFSEICVSVYFCHAVSVFVFRLEQVLKCFVQFFQLSKLQVIASPLTLVNKVSTWFARPHSELPISQLLWSWEFSKSLDCFLCLVSHPGCWWFQTSSPIHVAFLLLFPSSDFCTRKSRKIDFIFTFTTITHN